ncbi:hypothetical protein C8R44DRAFT_755827 [Mycena epipterygia]|nr:hypothetical protein C8R44DRAFT_755827 [Mycena epipterygia]
MVQHTPYTGDPRYCWLFSCSIYYQAIGGVNTWAVIKWTESFNIEVAPSPITSCELGSSSNIELVCYLSLLVGETGRFSVIVLLTLWKGFQICALPGPASRNSRFITTFYRDGILFYLAMLLSLIVDVVLQSVAPPALKFIANTPLPVIRSILVCHLVTHVRAVASEDETTGMAVKSLAFARFPAEITE